MGQSAAKLWPENDFQYGHNKILCTSKSEAAVIGNKKLRCTYVEADYRQTRSIERPLGDS